MKNGTQGGIGIGMEGTKSVGWMYAVNSMIVCMCMCGVARSMSMSASMMDVQSLKASKSRALTFRPHPTTQGKIHRFTD